MGIYGHVSEIIIPSGPVPAGGRFEILVRGGTAYQPFALYRLRIYFGDELQTEIASQASNDAKISDHIDLIAPIVPGEYRLYVELDVRLKILFYHEWKDNVDDQEINFYVYNPDPGNGGEPDPGNGETPVPPPGSTESIKQWMINNPIYAAGMGAGMVFLISSLSTRRK